MSETDHRCGYKEPMQRRLRKKKKDKRKEQLELRGKYSSQGTRKKEENASRPRKN